MSGGLKGIIFGGTGAVGKALISQILQSNLWAKIICVVRSIPEQWAHYQSKYGNKIVIQIQKDMDRLFKTQQWKYEGLDCMFVCYGSQVKHGEQTFVKIDKTYPLLCADIAIKNNIKHYLVVTAISSDPNSSLLYVRTKGQLQRDLQQKPLHLLSILRPGLIKNRPDARCLQKIWKCCFCYPNIECEDLGFVLKGLAENKWAESVKMQGRKVEIYENRDLLELVQGFRNGGKGLYGGGGSEMRINQ